MPYTPLGRMFRGARGTPRIPQDTSWTSRPFQDGQYVPFDPVGSPRIIGDINAPVPSPWGSFERLKTRDLRLNGTLYIERGGRIVTATGGTRWEISSEGLNQIFGYTGISTEQTPAYIYVVGTGPTVGVSETSLGLFGVSLRDGYKPPSITIDADYDSGGPTWTHSIHLNNVDTISLGGGSVWKTTATTTVYGNFVLPVKSDTGDPSSPTEGQIYVNTFDNKVRVYADAAWRDLATW